VRQTARPEVVATAGFFSVVVVISECSRDIDAQRRAERVARDADVGVVEAVAEVVVRHDRSSTSRA
jgi:hypothetical protein